mmetsp:Transcript_21002/g.52093  ORF Transcript_21002/g.52093 Transcript_21002/m.52093 type:complete len:229 (+) Transcript_21002:108-794(+)
MHRLFGNQSQWRPVHSPGLFLKPRLGASIPRKSTRSWHVFYSELGHLVAAHLIGIVVFLVGLGVDARKAVFVIEILIVVAVQTRKIAVIRLSGSTTGVRSRVRCYAACQDVRVFLFSLLLLELECRTKGRGDGGIEAIGDSGDGADRPSHVTRGLGRSRSLAIIRTERAHGSGASSRSRRSDASGVTKRSSGLLEGTTTAARRDGSISSQFVISVHAKSCRNFSFLLD